MTTPKDLADVNPNAVYTRAQVAALFSVSDETVSNWVKDGKLHQVSPTRGRFLGADVLALLGDRVQLIRPVKADGPTSAEWQRRAEDAAAKCLTLTRRR